MKIDFDVEKIKALMQSFYIVSGIRFVLFDTEFNEIASYPEQHCDFCRLVRACPTGKHQCGVVDKHALQKCKETQESVIYQCHAGLVEAAIPVYDNGQALAFLMFGQVLQADHPQTAESIQALSDEYGIPLPVLKRAVKKITVKSDTEISAAATIMEACTSYIALKELITPKDDKLIRAAKNYIEENLSRDINIGDMCRSLAVSRSKLYDLFKKEVGMGIAEYIKKARMHRAKKLLKTTDMRIKDIAGSVGYSDYNYFSRVYKSVYKKSPLVYRKNDK